MASESAADSQQPGGCSGLPQVAKGNGTNCDRLKNCCALVAYLPDPLGRFLDDLRLELVPGCKPHAHVTILPPRPISVECVDEAAREAQRLCADFPPFEIETLEIAIFPKTDVIYLEIGMGAQRLHEMHDAMNTGVLGYKEPFQFHPHVTLAQELSPDTAVELAAVARRKLADFKHSRRFLAESMTFVRNIGSNCWIDVAECPLSVAVPVLAR